MTHSTQNFALLLSLSQVNCLDSTPCWPLHQSNMARTKKKAQPGGGAAAGGAADAAAAAGGDDGPSTSYGTSLPEHLELARSRVVCGTDMNLHVSAAGRAWG